MAIWLFCVHALNAFSRGKPPGNRSKRSVGAHCIDDVFDRSKALSDVEFETQKRAVGRLTDGMERPAGRKLITDYSDSALATSKRFIDFDATRTRNVGKLEMALRRIPIEVDSGRLSLHNGRVKANNIMNRINSVGGKISTAANLLLLTTGIGKSLIEGKPAEAGKAIGFFAGQAIGEQIAVRGGTEISRQVLSRLNTEVVSRIVSKGLAKVGFKVTTDVTNMFIKSGMHVVTKSIPNVMSGAVGLAFQGYGWSLFHTQRVQHDDELMADPNSPEWLKENSKISLGVSAMSESLGTIAVGVAMIPGVGPLIAAGINILTTLTNVLVNYHLEAVAQVETVRGRVGTLSDAEAGEIYARTWAGHKGLPAHLEETAAMREVYQNAVAHLINVATTRGFKAVFSEIEPILYTHKVKMQREDIIPIPPSAYSNAHREYKCIHDEDVRTSPLSLTEDSRVIGVDGDSDYPQTRLFDAGNKAIARMICHGRVDTPRHIKTGSRYTHPKKERLSCFEYITNYGMTKCNRYCPAVNTVLQDDIAYLSAFPPDTNIKSRKDNICNNAIGVRLTNALKDDPILFYSISHIDASTGGHKNVFVVDVRTKTIIGGPNDDTFLAHVSISVWLHDKSDLWLDGGAGTNTLMLMGRGGIPLAAQPYLKNIQVLQGGVESNTVYATKDCEYVDCGGGGDTIHLVEDVKSHELPEEILAVRFESTLKADSTDPTREMGNISISRGGLQVQVNRPRCLSSDTTHCTKTIPMHIYLDAFDDLDEMILYSHDLYDPDHQYEDYHAYSGITNRLELDFRGEPVPTEGATYASDVLLSAYNKGSSGYTSVEIRSGMPIIGRIFFRVGRYLIQPLMEVMNSTNHWLMGYNYAYKAVALLILDEQASPHSQGPIPFTEHHLPLYWCQTAVLDDDMSKCYRTKSRYRTLTRNPVHVIMYKDDTLYTGSDGHAIALQAEPGNFSIHCLQNRFNATTNALILGYSVNDLTKMKYYPEQQRLEIVANNTQPSGLKRVELFNFLPDTTRIDLQTIEGRLSFEVPARTAADSFIARTTNSKAIRIRSLRLDVFPVEASHYDAFDRVGRLKNPHFNIMKTLVSDNMLIVQDAAARTNLIRLSDLTSDSDVDERQPMMIDLGLGSDTIVVDIIRNFHFYMHTQGDDIKRINLRPYESTCENGRFGHFECYSREEHILVLTVRCEATRETKISVYMDNIGDYRRLHILHGDNSYSTIERSGQRYSFNTREENPTIPMSAEMPIFMPAEWLNKTLAYMPHLVNPEKLTAMRLQNSSDLLLYDPGTGGSLIVQNVTAPFHMSYGNEIPDYAHYQPTASERTRRSAQVVPNAAVYSIDVPDLAALPTVEEVLGAIQARENLELMPRSFLGIVDLRREISDPQIKEINVHFSAYDPEQVLFTLPANGSAEAVPASNVSRSWLIQRPGQVPLKLNIFEAVGGENATTPEHYISVLANPLPRCDSARDDSGTLCEMGATDTASLYTREHYELLHRLSAKEFATDAPISKHYHDPAPARITLSAQTPPTVRLQTNNTRLPIVDATYLRQVSFTLSEYPQNTATYNMRVSGQPTGTNVSRIAVTDFYPLYLDDQEREFILFMNDPDGIPLYHYYYLSRVSFQSRKRIRERSRIRLIRTRSALLPKEITLNTAITHISAQFLKSQKYFDIRLPLNKCGLKRFGPHLVLEGESEKFESRALLITDFSRAGTTINEFRPPFDPFKITCTAHAPTNQSAEFSLTQMPEKTHTMYVVTARGELALRYYDIDTLYTTRIRPNIVVPLLDSVLAVINLGNRTLEALNTASSPNGNILITGQLEGHDFQITVTYPPDSFRPLKTENVANMLTYLKYQDQLVSIGSIATQVLIPPPM